MRRVGAYARDILAPALFACWCAYMAYGSFASAAGYPALRALQIELTARRAELVEIETRRSALEKRADLLNPRSIDPDMLEERIRAVLGYARDDEIVLPRSEISRLKDLQAE